MDALERLEPFVGDWTLEARFGGAPPADTAGAATFEWELGGKYLVLRTTVAHPDAPDSLAIMSVNEDGQTYTQHYFDSRGVTRLYSMRFDGRAWELQRESADFSPLPFPQRFTGTFSDDGSSIAGRWERGTSEDAATSWAVDVELIYTRAR